MKITNYIIILIVTLSFGFSACSSFYSSTEKSSPEELTRNPSSIIETKYDLLNIVKLLEEAVELGTDDTAYCSRGLASHYDILFNLTSRNLKINELTPQGIDEIIKTSFVTRLNLMRKIAPLNINNETDKECLSYVRRVIMSLRYVEDYLITIKMTLSGKDISTETNFINLKGTSLQMNSQMGLKDDIYFLINPKYQASFKDYNDLKSGDVLLTRGNTAISAAIARIGENASQFSHISFVYKDENGELYTTEAHIEVGSIVAPIINHIEAGHARTVVFRYKDQKIAHEASKFIFDKVKKAQEKKKNIPYDFAMDYKNSDNLFCSEVVFHAMDVVSGGQINVPKHKTKFEKGLIPFLQIMGIAINEKNIDEFDTFAPGDIQFDSDFELVAEWRNPAKIKSNIMNDAVLTMMFKFMREDNMRFYPGLKNNLTSKVAWIARRTPLINSLLKDKMPTNMTSSQLRLFFTLEEVAQVFYDHLEQLQKNQTHPMSPVEMFQALEHFKNDELNRYKIYQKAYNEYHSIQNDSINRGSGASNKRMRQLNKIIKQNKPRFAKRFR